MKEGTICRSEDWKNIKFVPVIIASGIDKKTVVYKVFGNSRLLGKVSWHRDFRMYCLYPYNNSFFIPFYLDSISEVCEMLTKEVKVRHSVNAEEE